VISSILDRPWLRPACFAVRSAINVGLYLDFANYHDAGNMIRHGEAATLYHPYALINGRPAHSAMVRFGQLVLPVVWERYLSVLFLPFAYLLACRRYLNRESTALLAAISILPAVRNFSFLLWMRGAPIHQAPFPLWALVLVQILRFARFDKLNLPPLRSDPHGYPPA
jgi:hypothetical protein